MPTYDYECPKCGERIEIFHGMLETRRVKCPECNGRMRKMLGTGAGIIFKGSGFYETDYGRSESYKAAAKAESAKPSASGKKNGKESASSDGATAAGGTAAKAKAKPKKPAGAD